MKCKQTVLSVLRSRWFPGTIYQVTMNIPRGSELSGNGSFLTLTVIYPDGNYYDYAQEWECDQQVEVEWFARKQDEMAHHEAMEIRHNVR